MLIEIFIATTGTVIGSIITYYITEYRRKERSFNNISTISIKGNDNAIIFFGEPPDIIKHKEKGITL